MTANAVFFDVDFTLIYPGPTFRGEGYQAFCARYGMAVDPSKFEAGVTSAAPLTESYYLQLQRALEQATGKRVAIERKTDASLIAGVVTKVGDKVFDGSVRTRLAELKETLKSA